jgi:hypothetical protein
MIHRDFSENRDLRSSRDFFFWSRCLRASSSLRFDFIKIAYSSSSSFISRWSRKSVDMCLFIDPGMKRDHVLSTWSRRATHRTQNRTRISRSSVLTSFRRSYLFQLTTIVLRACSLLVDWDRIHIVERWIDTDQSLHLDTDQETVRQSAKNGLWLMIYSFESHRSFLFVMKSEIIFRDFFLYLTQIFTFLSVYSRCLAARERIWSAGDLFFWISLNQIRVASQSEQISFSQVLKFLSWRQILNHS